MPAAWTHELRRRPLSWAAVALAAVALLGGAAREAGISLQHQRVDMRASPDGIDHARSIDTGTGFYGEDYAP